MSGLPTGWAEAKLGAVATARMGKTILSKELVASGLPVFSASVGPEPWGYVDDRSTVFSRGTLVISARGTIGDVKLPEHDLFVSTQTTIALQPSSAVVPSFLRKQLSGFDWPSITATTAIPMLTIGKLDEIEVRVPPLAEQRRIVTKLDTLTARTARARADLDRIPALAARYKQAVLAKAFSGELTAGWRALRGDSLTEVRSRLPEELSSQPLPSSWAMLSLAEAADNLDGRRVPVRASDRAARRGAYPYYGASGAIDTIDEYLFEGEHVLIGEDGANLISRSTPIAFLASDRFWVNNHAHVLKAREQTTNLWICWFFQLINLRPYVTGSAQPKLTQAALNKLHLPIPSRDEQDLILQAMQQAFAEIDRMASEAAAARRLLDRLDRALLAKAFRGELVPQDPADEPASVLLDRIRAERASAPKAKRRRRVAA